MDNNRDPVDYLAKALANLCIDEMGSLTRQARKTAVWVSTARFFGLRISELEEKVGMKATSKGAFIEDIARFIRIIQDWVRDMNGMLAMFILEVVGFAADFAEYVLIGMMAIYRRPDGIFKVLRVEGVVEVYGLTVSDTGYNLINEVKSQETMVEFA